MRVFESVLLRCCVAVSIVIFSFSHEVSAQRFSISTNLVDYANFGTLNLEASYGVARNWSVGAGVRYNPFRFENSDRGVFYNRQHSWSVGARYWLWHLGSGWWFGSKLRYQQYSVGGLLREGSEEGDRYGLGMYAGYSYMIFPHFNIEFGLGMWGGLGSYKAFSCPVCGLTTGEGNKMFLLPDDVLLSLVYVF